jgi:hypothetical protein
MTRPGAGRDQYSFLSVDLHRESSEHLHSPLPDICMMPADL